MDGSWIGGPALSCAPPFGDAPSAVCKVGYSRPVFPDSQGDHGNYCVPRHKTAQILTQSKNSDNDLNQPMFHTENARLLSESAFFPLWTCASPAVGHFQGGHRKANLLSALAMVRTHRARCELWVYLGTLLLIIATIKRPFSPYTCSRTECIMQLLGSGEFLVFDRLQNFSKPCQLYPMIL